MQLNKYSINFSFSKENKKLLKPKQKEHLKNIEEHYSKLHKRCLESISLPIEGTHKDWITARVNLHSNTSIMRLLYLTESFCDASKKFNSVSMASLIKSMTEIPLHIGYLTWIVSKNNDFEKIRKFLDKIAFGNRDKKTKLTSTSKVSGKELYEKTDTIIKEISKIKSWDILETIYKEGNALGHNNYEGRNMLCGLQNDGIWYAKDRKELFKFYSNNIFQFFLYCDTILGISELLLDALDHYLSNLPKYFKK